jgi:PBP1b-binding outer membrane lipoprotein LpoB
MRMEGELMSMKKLLVLGILAAFALSGCASGSFLGLATTKYVDDKRQAALDAQAAAIDQLKTAQAAQIEEMKTAQAAQIEELKAQLADYQAIKAQAQAAIEQMSQTTKTVSDLQALAKRAEDRIATIPKEVIKQIADILQTALK